MPFPLAHPAAVLPLRRLCPRYLSFPALLIGSLAPDAGYFTGHFQLGQFSHRFFAGVFGFCLPVGLLILLIFYFARSPVVGVLPAGWRQLLLPLCRQPAGSPFSMVVSLLIGAWSHIILDSIARRAGWSVEPALVLQVSLPWFGKGRFAVYHLLHSAFTFIGVAWLAWSYLGWLERAGGVSAVVPPGVKWVLALLLASAILLIAGFSRGGNQSGIISGGIITLLLLVAFLWGTQKWFRRRHG